MKNNNSERGYLFSKKGFYITAAIGIFAVLAAIVTLRFTTKKVKNDLTSFISQNTAPFTGEVQNDLTDVPDTRDFPTAEEITDGETETEAKSETTTAESTTEKKTSETSESETAPAAKIENDGFCLPTQTGVLKGFSPETPVFSKTMGDYRVHGGVDFEGKEGDEVCSVGNGVVSRVLADTMWGYIIEIDHGEFTARYVGLGQDGTVGIGESVSKGQKLGSLALIPAESEDGFHLHFEVLKDGKNVDPVAALGLGG